MVAIFNSITSTFLNIYTGLTSATILLSWSNFLVAHCQKISRGISRHAVTPITLTVSCNHGSEFRHN